MAEKLNLHIFLFSLTPGNIGLFFEKKKDFLNANLKFFQSALEFSLFFTQKKTKKT
jgi:hypothetical protein